MAKWKNFLIAASVALTPLLATCSSNASQEKHQYELDGETITVNVCQNQLTAGMYQQIKTLWEGTEVETTIAKAEEITGCDFQLVKERDGTRYYQALNKNNGRVVRQIVLSSSIMSPEGKEGDEGEIYITGKTHRGLSISK
jgi:hypothetical protein